ncbi:pseudouridine synthase [Vibrio tapetis subsp. quintayensis]|uniref:RluA family pseudouridine synthase n=1 Tax=Vibrio tapetis TaxID=52443 RepID=UPI0025B2A993|nr:pseudouridine synthase [Vibrio tapetis]MDN3680775.1 pseudouridine synthase [Vibrio tapetis subsp. quintayensis]
MTPNNNANFNPFSFTPFLADVTQHTLPDSFTFPYYYSPHPIAIVAMEELQAHLAFLQSAQAKGEAGAEHLNTGNMFAVLVVENQHGQLGYLSSYAGRQSDAGRWVTESDRFVSAVYDIDTHHQQLATLQRDLDEANSQLSELEISLDVSALTGELSNKTRQSEQEIADHQLLMSEGKKRRKALRVEAESRLASLNSLASLDDVIKDLGNESSREKRQFKALKQQWQASLKQLADRVSHCHSRIEKQREVCSQFIADMSIASNKACQFLNQSGELKSLYQLFDGGDATPHSSEQNLPKLLQSAFTHNLKPIALAEFWWGSPPYDSIRQHKNLYPVCQSKCFEILEHMLNGIALDQSPLEQTPSFDKELEIVYEDDVLVVVNKPAEFLSVSGKYISDSVHARIQQRYPNATGPLIVHRLDMSTSGLLVLTLTAETNKHVQKQFIERTVEKRYTALLEGAISDDGGEALTGEITLPICGDLEDRPRQMVCHKLGKKAETRYQILEVNNQRTKVHLFPKTGRTHQLRVHCAHQAGLNTPIVGDDLYGFKDSRLYLHAGYLKFSHPITNEVLEFEVPAEF